MKKFFSLGRGNQEVIYFFVYCDYVVQWFIDGYVAVIGYRCEQDDFNFIKEMFCKDLSYVVIEGDCFFFSK